MTIPIPRFRIPKPKHRDPVEVYNNLVKENIRLDEQERMLRMDKNPDAGIVGLKIQEINGRLDRMRKKIGPELLRRDSERRLSEEAGEFWS